MVGRWSARRTGHWLWAGTGLADGQTFGEINPAQLVDGTLLRFGDGLPYPDDVARTETPADFLALATLPSTNARPWWCWLAGTPRSQCAQRVK